MSVFQTSLSKLILVLSSTVLVVGCAAEPTDEATDTAEQSATTQRADRDVTVLQAWIGETVGRRYDSGYQLGDRAIDFARCSTDDGCDDAAQRLFESTLVGGFRYDANTSGQCETIEVRTIIREGALRAPSFTGIGLYLSTVGREVFVAKDALTEAGMVTLKDGSRAVVHRFVAQGTCFGLGGNGGSLMNRHYELKPYAQFDANGDTYKIWDAVRGDYRLGKSDGAFVRSFDRQDELLAR